MTWTKRQIIEQAFESIGLASYVFDVQSEGFQTGLRQLDTMVMSWTLKGIELGYPAPSSQATSDLDTQTNVPDWSLEALYQNLALRLAPAFGKEVMPQLTKAAYMGYQNLLSRFAKPPYEQQLPRTMPRGGGNKPWRFEGDEFMPKPYGPQQPYDDQESF